MANEASKCVRRARARTSCDVSDPAADQTCSEKERKQKKKGPDCAVGRRKRRYRQYAYGTSQWSIPWLEQLRFSESNNQER